MEFCQKCGAIIMVTDGKVACAACGFKPKKKPSIKSSEKIEKKITIAVIKEKDAKKCQKCKNKKAYFWTLQTRAADESETKFYKCTDCNHTWRIYK